MEFRLQAARRQKSRADLQKAEQRKAPLADRAIYVNLPDRIKPVRREAEELAADGANRGCYQPLRPKLRQLTAMLPHRAEALRANSSDQAALAKLQQQIGELKASMRIAENMGFCGG